MVKEIAFTAYPAKDVKALRTWYQQMLGVPFDNAYVEDGVEKYNEANVAGSFFSILLADWMGREAGTGCGVAFEVNDIDKAIADLRAKGSDWAAVAAELGGTPEARRKQLARAVARVEQELGFDTLLD